MFGFFLTDSILNLTITYFNCFIQALNVYFSIIFMEHDMPIVPILVFVFFHTPVYDLLYEKAEL